MKQSDPEELPGWLEGFWLAPSPAIDTAMLDLATSGRPAWICFALDVLQARGTASGDVISALWERPEPEIQCRVARALGSQLPRREAIDRLGSFVTPSRGDGVFLEAAEALLVRGHAPVLDLLRGTALAGGPRADGAHLLLALAGQRGDVDRLRGAAHAAPSAALVRALGRFGHIELLDTLIGLCGQEDQGVSVAAAEALERITGAGLYETVEEPWDLGFPPEAAHARDVPVPTRKVSRVVRDPTRWAAWVRGRSPGFEASVRTRAGRPFVASQIVAELRAAQTPPDRRDEALRELRIATGVVTAFSPWDWVARQEERLEHLEFEVPTRARPPGSWGMSIVRDDAALAPARTPGELVPTAATGSSAMLPPAAVTTGQVARPPAVLAPPEDTLDTAQEGAVTLPPQRAPERPVLPFMPVGCPGAPAPPLPEAAPDTLLAERIGGITIAQYTDICVAASRSSAEAERLFAQCGLMNPIDVAATLIAEVAST